MGDRDRMQPTNAPVAVSPDTVNALAVVHAWGRAFNERDLERLLALSTPDIRFGVDDRVPHGHEGLRRMVHLQSYGVAQHAHPVRYIARGSTVAVQASLELRWVDGGQLADTSDAVAVFEVGDGCVRSFRSQPDVAAAFRVAGWPLTDIP
jgi:ketosteroid isomerase-like protein